jgi:enoyl-CoA hydratase
LTADISIIAEEARLTEPIPGSVSPQAITPFFSGPKAKLYLLTADFIDGKEAERIGLLSRCVPRDTLMETAFGYADRLALYPQRAIRWTKRSLNHWLRQAGPIFDLSVAHEGLNFLEPDAAEGLRAFADKRDANFPSAPRADETPRS